MDAASLRSKFSKGLEDGKKKGSKLGWAHVITLVLIVLKVTGLVSISWLGALAPSIFVIGLMLFVLAACLAFMLICLIVVGLISLCEAMFG